MDVSSAELLQEHSGEFSPMHAVEIQMTPRPSMNPAAMGTKYTTEKQATSKSYKRTVNAPLDHKMANGASFRKHVSDTFIDSERSPLVKLSVFNARGQSMDSVYKKTLLNDNDSNTMVQCFLQESSELKVSDATGKDFSFEASCARLKEGCDIHLVNYKTYVSDKIQLCIDKACLFINQHIVPFKDVSGMLLGASSLTFRKMKERNTSLEVSFIDCFSILTNLRSYDFIVMSETTRYDIHHVFSVYIAAISPNPIAPIVLSKGKYILWRVKYVLNEVAATKYLSKKELLLFAIMKVLIQHNYPQSHVDTVKRLLDKSFTADVKIYRISTIMKPEDYKLPLGYGEKLREIERIDILLRRTIHQSFNSRDALRLYETWFELKNTRQILHMKSMKQFFKAESDKLFTQYNRSRFFKSTRSNSNI